MATPEEILANAQKVAAEATRVMLTRDMLSSLLPFLSGPEAYERARFPSLVDWTVRFIDAPTVKGACQVSQERLDRWLAGITPEAQARKVIVDTLRLAVEECMPT